MEKFYKDHRIEVSAWLDGDSWFVSLFIYYHEEATNILLTFSLNEKFTTYDGAGGLAAAQTWIDGKKRDTRGRKFYFFEYFVWSLFRSFRNFVSALRLLPPLCFRFLIPNFSQPLRSLTSYASPSVTPVSGKAASPGKRLTKS